MSDDVKVRERWFSDRLGMDIAVVRWGVVGLPVLVFPSAGGDAEEIERHGLVNACGPLLAEGRIKVYSVDSVAGQAMVTKAGPPEHRMWLLNQFQECVRWEGQGLVCDTSDAPVNGRWREDGQTLQSGRCGRGAGYCCSSAMISSQRSRHSAQMAAMPGVFPGVSTGIAAIPGTWGRYLPQKLHRARVCGSGTAFSWPDWVAAGSPEAITPRASSMQPPQMYTPGPAISFLTWA